MQFIMLFKNHYSKPPDLVDIQGIYQTILTMELGNSHEFYDHKAFYERYHLFKYYIKTIYYLEGIYLNKQDTYV